MRLTLAALVAFAALISACASQPPTGITVHYGPEALRAGAGVFRPGEPIGIDPDEILGLDDDMRAAVHEWVGDRQLARTRLRKLLGGMIDSGLLSLVYRQTKTKTARETYRTREGNCLAFTNLFVALGREAGLDVSFQVVDVPPFWYADSDTVVLATHVNVAVRTGRNDVTVVDFNLPEYQGDYEMYEVSDAYAFALYYNNIGMEALSNADLDRAFAYLRAALDADASIAGIWVNLGVLYGRKGAAEQAESAYAHALVIDPGNRSAMTNLVYLYRHDGRNALADLYAGRVQRYQNRNPYYYFINAEQAHASGDTASALPLVERAIRMKRSEHRFHSLKADILAASGKRDAALAALRTARKLASIPAMIQRYDKQISALNAVNRD